MRASDSCRPHPGPQVSPLTSLHLHRAFHPNTECARPSFLSPPQRDPWVFRLTPSPSRLAAQYRRIGFPIRDPLRSPPLLPHTQPHGDASYLSATEIVAFSGIPLRSMKRPHGRTRSDRQAPRIFRAHRPFRGVKTAPTRWSYLPGANSFATPGARNGAHSLTGPEKKSDTPRPGTTGAGTGRGAGGLPSAPPKTPSQPPRQGGGGERKGAEMTRSHPITNGAVPSRDPPAPTQTDSPLQQGHVADIAGARPGEIEVVVLAVTPW